MSVLLTITTALLITFIGARVAAHFKYPPMMGQFIASLTLAIPFIRNNMFTPEALDAIEIFSELAIIFLLLLAGLEINIEKINQCKKESILVGTLGSIMPLLLSLLVGRLIGLSWIASFALGISLSITAEGTNLAILLQLNKVKTKIGFILVSAGMLDDIIGMIYLSTILILIYQEKFTSIFFFPLKLLIFIGGIWIASKIVPHILRLFEKKGRDIAMFNMVILIALILSIFSELTGLSAIVGAFFAGIILQKSFVLKKDEKHEEHEIETFLFGFIIPFFFIDIALNFNFLSLFQQPALILIILALAIVGKMVGVYCVKLFDSLKWRQLNLIGWGMNSRGVIGLVVANIALKTDLISVDIYSAIVFVAIITTLLSLFVLRDMIKKNPKVME